MRHGRSHSLPCCRAGAKIETPVLMVACQCVWGRDPLEMSWRRRQRRRRRRRSWHKWRHKRRWRDCRSSERRLLSCARRCERLPCRHPLTRHWETPNPRAMRAARLPRQVVLVLQPPRKCHSTAKMTRSCSVYRSQSSSAASVLSASISRRPSRSTSYSRCSGAISLPARRHSHRRRMRRVSTCRCRWRCCSRRMVLTVATLPPLQTAFRRRSRSLLSSATWPTPPLPPRPLPARAGRVPPPRLLLRRVPPPLPPPPRHAAVVGSTRSSRRSRARRGSSGRARRGARRWEGPSPRPTRQRTNATSGSAATDPDET
mmetsp:Transcript_37085/g.86646  ORF Transcript_37085/g.86646 Transcript_37085/m.86646 type:complete len:315 (+) Transcript_37085:1034-1978(+)